MGLGPGYSIQLRNEIDSSHIPDVGSREWWHYDWLATHPVRRDRRRTTEDARIRNRESGEHAGLGLDLGLEWTREVFTSSGTGSTSDEIMQLPGRDGVPMSVHSSIYARRTPRSLDGMLQPLANDEGKDKRA